jgi:hypothetical protein
MVRVRVVGGRRTGKGQLLQTSWDGFPIEKELCRLSVLVHACNSSYSGGRGRRITV